jgi:hypothetical protein
VCVIVVVDILVRPLPALILLALISIPFVLGLCALYTIILAQVMFRRIPNDFDYVRALARFRVVVRTNRPTHTKTMNDDVGWQTNSPYFQHIL